LSLTRKKKKKDWKKGGVISAQQGGGKTEPNLTRGKGGGVARRIRKKRKR